VIRGAALLAAFAVAATTPAAAQQAGQPLSDIAQAAAQRGVKVCLDSIDALAKDLSASHRVGVFLFNRVDGADTNVVSLSMELTPSPSGASQYVSATFSPMATGACQTTVETVIAWQASCVQAGLSFPGYQMSGQLLEGVRTLSAGGTARLFLMTTPSGCVSIEKMIFF
jgi:hypothetical protein